MYGLVDGPKILEAIWACGLVDGSNQIKNRIRTKKNHIGEKLAAYNGRKVTDKRL